MILDYRYQNRYYTKPWSPKVPEVPECFAIAESEDDLVPSDNAAHKQATDCASCPMNVFGSKGEGKACRNTMQLAVMFPDLGDGDNVMTLSVSPTAKKDVTPSARSRPARIWGSVIGALELIDERPRSLSGVQKESLRDLAKIAERELNTVAFTPAQEEVFATDAAGASRIDQLTRLWTRSSIVDILQRELAYARRRESTVGLALVDVDQLRNLNATHGHEAGDSALRELTKRLRACLRPYDAVGRFGGEE